MFKLLYPDGSGDDIMIGSFESQQACLDKDAADGQKSFTIQQVVDSKVVMVISC